MFLLNKICWLAQQMIANTKSPKSRANFAHPSPDSTRGSSGVLIAVLASALDIRGRAGKQKGTPTGSWYFDPKVLLKWWACGTHRSRTQGILNQKEIETKAATQLQSSLVLDWNEMLAAWQTETPSLKENAIYCNPYGYFKYYI